ncbi:MAG TPA: aldo/keto reductase [Conexibacter sp.]|jgi:aryl-alcohol dehydrogenase-like predicted oxidoreductase
MEYRQLGRTGAYVSSICLGTMTFGGASTPPWQALGGLDLPEVDAIVGRALEAGVNFIDTANMYAGGESEELLGKALRGRRDEVVLATKVHARMGAGPNDVGQSRLHVMAEIDASLRRLGTDHIDLYQLHGFDQVTPPEETLRTLDDAVRAGKVRYIGCSNFAAWQIARWLGVSALRELEQLVSVQAYYSMAGRDLEHELLPLIDDAGLGLLVWSPLAGGLLSGKATRDADAAEGTRRAQHQFPPVDRELAFDVIDVARPIAERHGVTVARVALAWLLSRRAVTSVIVGARRLDQLDDNLAAVDLQLEDDELAALNEAGAPPALYPGWIHASHGPNRYPQPA